MSHKYVFPTDAVMHSRTNTAPTINNSFNTVIVWLDIGSFADPIMVAIENNRNKIRNGKTIIQPPGVFFVFNGNTITGFG
jgi:hypothetical protein